MRNDFVCVLTDNENYFLQSLKQLLDEEIVSSRILILYSKTNLEDKVNSFVKKVKLMPVEILVKKTKNPLNFIKSISLNRRVVFLSETVLLSPSSIIDLSRGLVKPEAGAICAGRNRKLLVDDIYSPKVKKEVKENGLVPVDLIENDVTIIKSGVLKDLSFDRWLGLSLRRLGYQNFLDTTVQVDIKEEKQKCKN